MFGGDLSELLVSMEKKVFRTQTHLIYKHKAMYIKLCDNALKIMCCFLLVLGHVYYCLKSVFLQFLKQQNTSQQNKCLVTLYEKGFSKKKSLKHHFLGEAKKPDSIFFSSYKAETTTALECLEVPKQPCNQRWIKLMFICAYICLHMHTYCISYLG